MVLALDPRYYHNNTHSEYVTQKISPIVHQIRKALISHIIPWKSCRKANFNDAF